MFSISSAELSEMTLAISNCDYMSTSTFFLYRYRNHRVLHSFPTRRSSDLGHQTAGAVRQGQYASFPPCRSDAPTAQGGTDSGSAARVRRGPGEEGGGAQTEGREER